MVELRTVTAFVDVRTGTADLHCAHGCGALRGVERDVREGVVLVVDERPVVGDRSKPIDLDGLVVQ